MKSWTKVWSPLAACGIAGALGWALAPGSAPATAPVVAAAAAWALPELPRRPNLTQAAGELALSPLWGRAVGAGQPGTASAAPTADPRWRVAGTFSRGSSSHALIVYFDPAKPPLQVKVGDKLPSGHVVTSIEPTAVCIQIGASTHRLAVERVIPKE